MAINANKMEYTIMSGEEFVNIWRGEFRENTNYQHYYNKHWNTGGVVFTGVQVSTAIIISDLKSNEKLPSLLLKNCIIPRLHIVSTHIGTMTIYSNSQIGGIYFRSQSQLEAISIGGNSNVGDIYLRNNSHTSRIHVFNGSKTGNINIIYGSKIDNIEINSKAQIGDLTIAKKSKALNVSIGTDSIVRNILISNASSTQRISISENSKAENISVCKSSKTNTISVVDNSETGYISVSEESQAEGLFINSNSNTGYLEISKNSLIGDLTVLYKCWIGTIFVAQNSKIGDIEIEYSKTLDISISNNCQAGNITIKQNSNTGKITISDYCKIGNLSIFGSSTTADITVDNESSLNDIYLHNCNINKEVSFSHVYLDKLSIGNIYVLDEFIINSAHIKQLEWLGKNALRVFIHKSIIEHFNLKQAVLPKDNVLHLNDSSLNHINFNSTQNFGIIQLVNCAEINMAFQIDWIEKDIENEITNEDIHNANEEQEEWFISIHEAFNIIEKEKPSCLTLTNSDLGRTSFIGCDFTAFNKFEFYNTKILDVFLAGTNFPKEILVSQEHIDNILEQQRLAYGQFKKLYEARGDMVTALEYRAKELEVYRQQLIKDDKKGNRSERIHLWVHKNTNNYGTEWWMALWKTLLIAVFCYIIYSLLLGNYFTLNWNVENRSCFWENVSHFPEFFNPIHRADALEEKINKHSELNGFLVFARFWNYLSRFIISFMVFQTIQAFRKHGRSS